MSVSTTFDLLLRGGRVIDPASGVDGFKDVACVDAGAFPGAARGDENCHGVVFFAHRPVGPGDSVVGQVEAALLLEIDRSRDDRGHGHDDQQGADEL